MRHSIISLFALLSFCGTLHAQGFRIGPMAQGGINFTNDSKTKATYSVGVKGEFDFKDAQQGWFLDAAILFSNHNLQSTTYYETAHEATHSWKYSNYSLTIPVTVGYKFGLSDKLSLFAAAGPYIDLGLTGTSKVHSNSFAGADTETKVSDNVYKDKLFNRFSVGANVKLGLDIARHYQVSLSYDQSLSHLSKGSNDIKNQSLQLGFAYMF